MSNIFQVLTLAWSIQGGHYDNNALAFNNLFRENSNFFVQYSFELRVPLSALKGDGNYFYVGSDVENQFTKLDGNVTLSPMQDSFTFSSGIHLFGVEIGYTHNCVHPILSTGSFPSFIFSSYDKISISTRGSF